MRVRACTKTFEGRQVLSVPDIPLTLGKIYALAGANGSGKSTFARRLADEAWFFWRGQLWEQGTAKRVLCTPEREETRQFLTFYGGSTSSAGQPGKSCVARQNF